MICCYFERTGDKAFPQKIDALQARYAAIQHRQPDTLRQHLSDIGYGTDEHISIINHSLSNENTPSTNTEQQHGPPTLGLSTTELDIADVLLGIASTKNECEIIESFEVTQAAEL